MAHHTFGHFSKFREGIIGIDGEVTGPDGRDHKLVYADWVASGRSYLPIEKRIQESIMPLMANTHTETSSTGTAMTHAYHKAQQLIKEHVNAGPGDVIITACSGMTRVVNKFQRILDLKYQNPQRPESEVPVIFITHMEHHSNQTSWLETNATTEIINPTPDGLVDLDHLRELLEKYNDRILKIASVTACSNVTGIATPYHDIARIMHEADGYCFVDFACSAPYVNIDMHPEDGLERLDAIFFSPHKFLGGPGSAGVLIFSSELYHRKVPDNPGGGTVEWTNPWGGHKYVKDIEAREDGGTPAFLQTIKTAMCISLKEEMGTEAIMEREHYLLDRLWNRLEQIDNLHILAPNQRDRLAVISFYIDELHYNLGVRLLNDHFGIQCRGGCTCAGTYGHYLLNVDHYHSKEITDMIDQGIYSLKPGWIRISLHPTLTDEEVDFIGEAVAQVAANFREWGSRYSFNSTYTSLSCGDQDMDANLKEQMDKALTQDFARSNPALTLER
jgi:selenocysteine lyase/cysteine desulfurase